MSGFMSFNIVCSLRAAPPPPRLYRCSTSRGGTDVHQDSKRPRNTAEWRITCMQMGTFHFLQMASSLSGPQGLDMKRSFKKRFLLHLHTPV